MSLGGLILLAVTITMGVGLPTDTRGGIFPHQHYLWNPGPCSEMVDAYDEFPTLYLGVCNGTTWEPTTAPVINGLDYDAYVLPGDWDRDNCSDMIGIKDGTLNIIAGDCDDGITFTSIMGRGTGWGGYNYFIAPGDINGDFFPDLLARLTSSGSLVVHTGDGDYGFQGESDVLLTDWAKYDITLGADFANGDGNMCPDLIARDPAAAKLYLYVGDCQLSFGNPTEVDVSQYLVGFDQLFSGGDWYREAARECADIAAWDALTPGTVYVFGGNCDGTFILPPIPIYGVDQDDWIAPFTGESTKIDFWGDVDCNSRVTPVDGLKLLQVDSGMPVTQKDGCRGFRGLIGVNGADLEYGDVDCSGGIGPVDALKVLNVDAGNPPQQTVPECPAFGESYRGAWFTQ